VCLQRRRWVELSNLFDATHSVDCAICCERLNVRRPSPFAEFPAHASSDFSNYITPPSVLEDGQRSLPPQAAEDLAATAADADTVSQSRDDSVVVVAGGHAPLTIIPVSPPAEPSTARDEEEEEEEEEGANAAYTHENVLLDCGHTFHTQCLSSWLARGASCPICRAAFSKPTDVQRSTELITVGNGLSFALVSAECTFHGPNPYFSLYYSTERGARTPPLRPVSTSTPSCLCPSIRPSCDIGLHSLHIQPPRLLNDGDGTERAVRMGPVPVVVDRQTYVLLAMRRATNHLSKREKGFSERMVWELVARYAFSELRGAAPPLLHELAS
jgi:hypothetical protein